jgi:hypothetical protein
VRERGVKWLLSIAGGVITIGLVGGVVALAKFAPGAALTSVLALCFLLPLAWVLISTFYPVPEDRNCPACGAWALEPLDPNDRYGVRCSECGHIDPTIPGARLGHEPPAKGVQ